VGSHVADRLLTLGADRVVVLDDLSRGLLENLEEAQSSGRLTFVDGDIGDAPLLARLLDGVDLLFHFAALRLTRCAQEPRRGLEVMVDGTFNVLEAAVAAGVTRVVAASSASIYGDAETFPIREDHHPYNNKTLYGAGKLFAEGLLASFREMYGLDYVALRYFNIYGPRMDVNGAYTEVLVRWMERIDHGLPPIVFGDGKESMDFVYIDDVVQANVLAASSTVSGEVFNVASGVEVTLDELARCLLATMGSDLSVEYGPPRALTTVPRRLADTTAARLALGFDAKVDLAEGLCRLVSWWREAKSSR
jgi:UDP-glucose 4-epimerase